MKKNKEQKNKEQKHERTKEKNKEQTKILFPAFLVKVPPLKVNRLPHVLDDALLGLRALPHCHRFRVLSLQKLV
jgi:hypothetical protein